MAMIFVMIILYTKCIYKINLWNSSLAETKQTLKPVVLQKNTSAQSVPKKKNKYHPLLTSESMFSLKVHHQLQKITST
jgi:hypothetical protein